MNLRALATLGILAACWYTAFTSREGDLDLGYVAHVGKPECEDFQRGGEKGDASRTPVPGMAHAAAIFAVRGVTATTKSGGVSNWYASKGCRILMPLELTNVAALASGTGGMESRRNSVFALKADGTVWKWSYPSYVLLQEPLSEITKVTAGLDHYLAVKKDGTVWAWGSAGHCGEGGNQPVPPDYSRSPLRGFGPQRVKGLGDSVDVSAGKFVSVALQADGTVWWWGRRGAERRKLEGQSWGDPACLAGGNGESPPPQPTPERVPGLSEVVAIATGYMHHLALKRDGTVWAWGLNDCGQTGARPAMPERSMDYHGGALRYLRAFVPMPRQIDGLSNVKAVAAGARHSLALKSDGTVWSWGNNDVGQLGGEGGALAPPQAAEQFCRSLFGRKEIFSFEPQAVSDLTGVIAVAAGSSSSIALKADGTVWVWGEK